jgi:hypothetical protein
MKKMAMEVELREIDIPASSLKRTGGANLSARQTDDFSKSEDAVP